MQKNARNFGKTTFFVRSPRSPFEIPKFPETERPRIHPPNSSLQKRIWFKAGAPLGEKLKSDYSLLKSSSF